MADFEVLESVLDKDLILIENVGPQQLHLPTPCPEYDVNMLVNHIIGWLQRFESGVNGRTFDGDPGKFVSSNPVNDFRNASAGLLAGWSKGGIERTVRLGNSDLPGKMVMSMTLTEYLTHGCDLAVATDQAVPFSEEEIALVLERASATLGEQYRGEGKPFGHIVDVTESAPLLDRFLGFMGRQPLTVPKHIRDALGINQGGEETP
ncbi:MAG: TIGR03086 family protein [Acidimicrobiaceae bacterium]|nr:TIGR03086 family protein [Acidimicrobiaceae bacterium]